MRNLESFKSDALNSDLNHEPLPAGKTTKKEKLSVVTATKSGFSRCSMKVAVIIVPAAAAPGHTCLVVPRLSERVGHWLPS